MSAKLKPVDLTGAIVGTTGTIDFNRFPKFAPNDMSKKAHIWMFNESGCGLDLSFNASNNSHYLPAGGWGTFDVEPNDASVKATVTYVLPNPPVSTLNAIYYFPGEPVPQTYTLGNSPIGIGGNVNTSNVSTLSNEGNASNFLVIDMGDVAFAQVFTLYNDGHCLWAVDQAGVKHQCIKVQTAGNPLQLGQAGDITEVLGALTIDSPAATALNLPNGAIQNPKGIATGNGATGNMAAIFENAIATPAYIDVKPQHLANSDAGIQICGRTVIDDVKHIGIVVDANGNVSLPVSVAVPNGIGYAGLDTTAIARALIYADGSNNTVVRAAGGNVALRDVSNNLLGYIDATSLKVAGKRIDDTGGNGLIDWSAAPDVYVKGVGSGGVFHFQTPDGSTQWSMSHIAVQQAALTVGTHSYSHNLGWTPDYIVITAVTASSSATVGYDSPGVNTVNFTVGASLTYRMLFMKF